MAGQATFDACYPYARDHLHFPEHLQEGFETHKVTEIYTTMGEDPEIVIDVSDVIDTRIEALKAHRSQIGDPDGIEERIKSRTSEFAEKHGYQYAEGFRRHVFGFRPPPTRRD